MESLRFEIHPTPEETQRACNAIVRACLPPSRGNAILSGLYALVWIAAFFLARSTWLTTFLIGLTAVAATALSLQAEGRSRLRRLRVGDKHARETHFVELTPDGIRAWCSHVEARYAWADFFKVVENPEFFLFVQPSGIGTAVPKRLLDESADAQLRARICEWSPDGGAGLGRGAVDPSTPPSRR